MAAPLSLRTGDDGAGIAVASAADDGGRSHGKSQLPPSFARAASTGTPYALSALIGSRTLALASASSSAASASAPPQQLSASTGSIHRSVSALGIIDGGRASSHAKQHRSGGGNGLPTRGVGVSPRMYRPQSSLAMAADDRLDSYLQHSGLRHSASAAVVSDDLASGGSGGSTDSDDDSTTARRQSRSARIAVAAAADAADLVPVSLSGSGLSSSLGSGGASSSALMSNATSGTLVASIAGMAVVQSGGSPTSSSSALSSSLSSPSGLALSAATGGVLTSPSSRGGAGGNGAGGVPAHLQVHPASTSASRRAWARFKVYLSYGCAHWAREKYLLFENWRVLLSFVVVQYIHVVAMNAAYYMNTPREPLWDVGFEVLPYVPTDTPRFVAQLMLAVTLGFVVSPFVRNQQNPRRPVFTTLVVARFCMVLILAQALRVVTFIVTTLPGPSEKCRPDSPLYAPPRSYADVFTSLRFDLMGVGCGDLVFSSAMIWVVLCALTISHYSQPDGCYPSAAAASTSSSAAAGSGADDRDDHHHDDDDALERGANGDAAAAAGSNGDADAAATDVSRQPLPLRVLRPFAWLLVVVFGVAQVAARTHYTLDVLVAGYTVPLLWVAVLRYVPDRVPPDFQTELQYGLWTCSCDSVFASPKDSAASASAAVDSPKAPSGSSVSSAP